LRIAIAAAKSVGTAVVRNRIRRRIRGAFEALGPGKDAPGMLFLVVRDEAVGLPYSRIVEDVRILLGRVAR
jgi:ribonuclease P protein component